MVTIDSNITIYPLVSSNHQDFISKSFQDSSWSVSTNEIALNPNVQSSSRLVFDLEDLIKYFLSPHGYTVTGSFLWHNDETGDYLSFQVVENSIV